MISIVIPAYNEEHRIGRTLTSFFNEFTERPYELIVVPNNCSDNTVTVVKRFQVEHPDSIRIIEIPDAVGKGGALLRGFAEAKGDIVGFIDADLATPISNVLQCIHLLKAKNIDGVIASRLLPDSKVHDRGIVRTLVGRSFAALVRLLFDLDYRDTQCGAKFFTKNALSKIVPDITARDMTIDVDILLSARKHKLKIYEAPTEWYDRSSSALLGSPLGLFSTSITMFRSLIRLQRKYE